VTPPIVIPNEVLSFLSDADEFRDADLRINPLTATECATQSAAMQEIDVVRTLGLIVLDDADDSNPYCYVSKGPAQGTVVHFSHDPEPQLRFHSLGEFLEALKTAQQDGSDIDDLQFPVLTPSADQRMLVGRVRELLEGSDEDGALQIGLYLPLLDPDDLDTLALCAAHEDFLVREIAATFILDHAKPALRGLAERLAADKSAQVSRPAQQALARLSGTRK